MEVLTTRLLPTPRNAALLFGMGYLAARPPMPAAALTDRRDDVLTSTSSSA